MFDENEAQQTEAESCPPHPDDIKRARAAVADENEMQAISDFFRLFSDSTRIKILTALGTGSMCVCDISEALGMTQSAVSHQLRVLRGGDLVRARRDGKSVVYSLSDDHIETVIRAATEHIREG
ncbi:MAG: helix-turn-helix transcriptional regulator [Thermoplasmatales archaeon]|jgi:DNA-binding transcriptional ArsR family regulator|nr:helix-turn-helix transcriptional regulator [Thermoplasmatales archaeon]